MDFFGLELLVNLPGGIYWQLPLWWTTMDVWVVGSKFLSALLYKIISGVQILKINVTILVLVAHEATNVIRW